MFLNVDHMTDDARERLAALGYDWQGYEIEIPDDFSSWTFKGPEHAITIKGAKFTYSDSDHTLRVAEQDNMETNVNQVSGQARAAIENKGGVIIDDDALYEDNKPIINLPNVAIRFPQGTTQGDNTYVLPDGTQISFTLQGEETWAVC